MNIPKNESNLIFLILIMSNLHSHFHEIKLRLFYIIFSTIFTFVLSYNFQLEIIFIIGKPFLEFQQTFVFLELTEAFYTLIRISTIITLVVVLPFIIYHFWSFLVPSLYQFERYKTNHFCFFFFFLILCEFLFAYFILLPKICNFLLSFEIISGVDHSGLHLQPLLSVEFTARIESYVHIVVKILITLLFLFQIPFGVCLLYSQKILYVSNLFNNRKWLGIISLLMSALIVPPDMISQIIVAFFFYLLFEILIFIGLFFE